MIDQNSVDQECIRIGQMNQDENGDFHCFNPSLWLLDNPLVASLEGDYTLQQLEALVALMKTCSGV